MQKLISELKKHSSPKRKKANEWFFKTEKGQYGEGDKFLGINMPNLRAAVKKYHREATYGDVQKLIDSSIHEIRMAGLLILNEKYKENNFRAYKFYLKNSKRVNNWDLVDCSTPNVVGNYLVENQKEIPVLYKLAKSKNLWERRISIIATMQFIDKGYVDECLKISKILLNDKHGLIHKAVGWMLRESWKKKPAKVEKFLIGNYSKVPRTTLRYAIERMEERKRKRFLAGKF